MFYSSGIVFFEIENAFLVQDIFGGKVCGIPRENGLVYCYNVIDDHTFDLTSEQFGDEVLNYTDNPEQFREGHFRNTERKERYELLKRLLREYLDKEETTPSSRHNE